MEGVEEILLNAAAEIATLKYHNKILQKELEQLNRKVIKQTIEFNKQMAFKKREISKLEKLMNKDEWKFQFFVQDFKILQDLNLNFQESTKFKFLRFKIFLTFEFFSDLKDMGWNLHLIIEFFTSTQAVDLYVSP